MLISLISQSLLSEQLVSAPPFDEMRLMKWFRLRCWLIAKPFSLTMSCLFVETTCLSGLASSSTESFVASFMIIRSGLDLSTLFSSRADLGWSSSDSSGMVRDEMGLSRLAPREDRLERDRLELVLNGMALVLRVVGAG